MAIARPLQRLCRAPSAPATTRAPATRSKTHGGRHLAVAKRREDALREEAGATEVVDATEHADEVSDAERGVLTHAFDHPLRRAGERAGFHLLPAHAPGGGETLDARRRARSVRVDDHVPEPRLLDRVVGATLLLAVAPEHVELPSQLVDVAAAVPDVGVARDQPEQHALAAAADEDRRVWTA